MAVQVPGALNPLIFYVVHNKASSGAENQFRRGIELRRTITNALERLIAKPLDTEFVVAGDFNDDVTFSQISWFTNLPIGLPSDYVLGSDIVFPVKYRLYPTDNPAEIGFQQLDIYQEDRHYRQHVLYRSTLRLPLLQRGYRPQPSRFPARRNL